MKLEVGMYVRNENGYIGKIISQENDLLKIDNDLITYYSYHPEITKASHNIIDLIEYGDYVNGHKVMEINIENDQIYLALDVNIDYYENTLEVTKEDIKTVMTKEQFENNCYKIGD